jgi:glyoxylase-like metal-dependent hydrolase (beta-lactamase superfamily II)
MRVHHLNCGAMQPYGGALWDGQTPIGGPAILACHCLLIDDERGGLTLVDTGVVSSNPVADRARHSAFFRAVDRINLDSLQSAVARVRALGLDPGAVRHVVMTHLDFDHAAGLPDFPKATVHVSASEAKRAQDPVGPIARGRYRRSMWAGVQRWRTYAGFPDRFFGLPAARLDEMPCEMLLVSLPGHTAGHCGVAIRTEAGWLLHAGDAVFSHRELRDGPPGVPTLARAYQWFMEDSQVRRRRSLRALRRIARSHDRDVRIICTHDPSMLPVDQLPSLPNRRGG